MLTIQVDPATYATAMQFDADQWAGSRPCAPGKRHTFDVAEPKMREVRRGAWTPDGYKRAGDGTQAATRVPGAWWETDHDPALEDGQGWRGKRERVFICRHCEHVASVSPAKPLPREVPLSRLNKLTKQETEALSRRPLRMRQATR